MAKIKLFVSTGYVGSKVEETIDTEEDWNMFDPKWEDMTDDEKSPIVTEWVWEQITAGWEDLT